MSKFLEALTKILAAGFLAIFLFLIASSSCFAAHQQEQMLRDIETIRNIFATKYAPADWKHQYNGWNLDDEIERAKTQVLASENLTTKEFQRIIRDCLYTTKDFHVDIIFYSTESAKLPFRVKHANGKYFISHLHKDSPSSWSIGDEVIVFDNQPIGEAVAALYPEVAGDIGSPTNHAFAEEILTSRSGQLGHIVPSGKVGIMVKHIGNEHTTTYQLEWEYQPEKIKRGNPLFARENDSSIFDCCMLSPFYKNSTDSDSRPLLGYKTSVLPPLGKIIWESDQESLFHAYLYTTEEGHTIGFIRIPHYLGYEEEVKEFGEIMTLFEEQSDALIVDQLDNPGGYGFYEQELASILANAPLVPAQQQMTITEKDMFAAIEHLEESENENSNQPLKKFSEFIADQWRLKHDLTDPTYLFGIESIEPSENGHYTKPILVLINELDISAADFLPALLQDNNRAILMGSQTAGAGGAILRESFPNRFGIALIQLTQTIAYRLDGHPIENLGVTPDIPYVLTEKDLQEGYVDYANAINRVINTMATL